MLYPLSYEGIAVAPLDLRLDLQVAGYRSPLHLRRTLTGVLPSGP